jgi:uncharacterized protein YecE (DUF72 family)
LGPVLWQLPATASFDLDLVADFLALLPRTTGAAAELVGRHVSGYAEAALVRWAAKVRDWANQGDVYVYFDNTAEVAAPWNAQQLRALLDIEMTGNQER